jgi:adenosylcobyric acid synthase
MLGKTIVDKDGVESPDTVTDGLGMLRVTTHFAAEKRVAQVDARVIGDSGLLRGCAGEQLTGYEIHHGQTTSDHADSHCVLLRLKAAGSPTPGDLGILDETGRVLGTYMHGIFHNRSVAHGILANVADMCGLESPRWDRESDQDAELDRIADHVQEYLNMDCIYEIIRRGPGAGTSAVAGTLTLAHLPEPAEP